MFQDLSAAFEFRCTNWVLEIKMYKINHLFIYYHPGTPSNAPSGISRLPSIIENRGAMNSFRIADPLPGEQPLPRGM